jgi:hemolysin D
LPFTKYGILQGKVITVSTDAVFSESGGFIYPVKIAIPQSDIQAFGKKFPLSMGMTVVAEIQTDRRRLIDYFFSPIARYQDEALRER